jgi:hypothetical protein
MIKTLKVDAMIMINTMLENQTFKISKLLNEQL